MPRQVQQFGIVWFAQLCVLRSQTSVVHALPSPQSLFVVQQPGTSKWPHVWV